MAERSIAQVAEAQGVMEGAGVLVHRALPARAIPYDLVDPFLLLDDATVSPDDPGFPNHPHRGFEILTYLLQGSLHHTDDAGHESVAPAGAIQRITAGRGIYHGEKFAPGEGRREPVRALQLWINLAQAEKMIAPEYQMVPPDAVPLIRLDGGASIRLLAGERTPVELHTPITYVDATVPPGQQLNWPIPADWQGFAYVLAGRGRFGADRVEAGSRQILALGPGDRLTVQAEGDSREPLRFVLAAGQPHREPIRWRGGFVD